MYPSASLCRAQQTLQLGRAAATDNPNLRTIAERAAAAWGIEAGVADARERRQAKTTALRLAKQLADRAFSENPDRGFADG